MSQNHTVRRSLLVGVMGIFATFTCSATEIVEMESTRIKGDQEQPKVLYVIPWQNTVDDQRFKQPMESLMGEIFQPINRNAFLNEIRIHNAMKQGRKNSQ